MTGRHRGGRGLRARLVVAVLAAAVGRGYAGRHRLAEAALGRPLTATATATTAAVPTSRPAVEAAPMRRPVDAVLVQPLDPADARLTVVPVPAAPDPLTDTVPHPVVALFPLTADERSADIDAVFADVDADRDAAATVDLAAADPTAPGRYAGRHTA